MLDVPGRILRRGGLSGLLVLALMGCHSQQAVFLPRPAPTAMVAPTSAPAPARPTAATSTLAALAGPPASATAPGGRGLHQLPTSHPALRPAVARPLAAVPAVAYPGRQALRPQRAAGGEHDILHLVLGGLLVIGGVLTGLLLGGWLGLGVGALIVVLGYYFLVMGIGGSHAWREIFQEFFNM